MGRRWAQFVMHDRRRPWVLYQRVSEWPEGLPVVMEASFGWGWLCDILQELCLGPHLANCFKVDRMREARGCVKTNGKDADLPSLLPLEASNWWEVWLAPPEVRDRREWMRFRMSLVALGAATENRIQALFHRHGIFHEFSDLFGAARRKFLVELCREGKTPDVQLPAGALAALRGQVRLLDQIRQQLAEVGKHLRQELERSDLARRLDGIPGIGLILAHVLMAEIGQIGRFPGQEALASYSLLAPRAIDTGEPDPPRAPLGRKLGWAGNHMLKWAFIEAARGAVRKGGKWRKIFDGYTNGGRNHRNRGYIKVARELVKVVKVVWRKGVDYSDSPPPRPGSRRRLLHRVAEPNGFGS
jgi:transposase